jgi:hypothetical protein
MDALGFDRTALYGDTFNPVGGQGGSDVRDHDDPSHDDGGGAHRRRQVRGHQHSVPGTDQVSVTAQRARIPVALGQCLNSAPPRPALTADFPGGDICPVHPFSSVSLLSGSDVVYAPVNAGHIVK